MKKLKLAIDGLMVESFEVGAATEVKGTVHAHVTALGCNTGPNQTCGNFLTCAYPTCATETWAFDCTDRYTCGTCDATCGFSCDPDTCR
jgi:hypothetical protein